VPLEPPLPVSGVFLPGPKTLRMDFDRALVPGPIDPLNWTVHFGGTKYDGNTATAGFPAPHQVSVSMIAGFPPPAPGQRAYYNPPPFDVQGLNGVPAALFADFPIT
jgi:hypothetical protein